MLLLPSKKKLSELGVISIPSSGLPTPNIIYMKKREELNRKGPVGGKFKLLGISKQNVEAGPFVGVEYESNFTPTGEQIRRMKDFFIQQKLVEKVSDNITLLGLLKKYVFEDISECIYSETPETDGGGIELRFHPMTLECHQVLRSEYVRILKVFMDYGFTDQMGTDGIHINMDKKLFGPSVDIQRRSFANFIWFLYKCPEFMIEFCNRKRKDDQLADMLSLLGDRFGNLSEEEREDIFYKEKNILLDAIQGNEFARTLNIQVNKGGRATAEFRWFGSTHSANLLLSFVEWGFALPQYCLNTASPGQISLLGFCRYVAINHKKYGMLYSRLCELASTKNVIGNYKSIVSYS